MKPKIVLTDCDTVVSKGDIDLTILEKYGEVTYYGETQRALTAERIKDADIVIVNKTVIGKAEIDAAKNLKMIGLFATGYNNIDVAYAAEKGIAVCNAGVYSTSAVAQHVFAFILNHASGISDYSRAVENKEWINSRLFSFFARPTYELEGKTLGIFGFGAIGAQVAKIALAFNMRVIATTRTPKIFSGVEFVSFDKLLSESDYLTLHCPLTEETRELFNKEAFSRMKDGLYFINTARGGVVSESALLSALSSGKLSGAAIDVLTEEPMRRDCLLFGAPNITITPHVAWAPIETRTRLLSIVCDNIESFLAGAPKNKVN
ncbi:MAG: D-2-hydroxyacid dehydrogenase [Ruminococcaceae bacterium]|nr:D-2-hydroxyacid dehydrogenase [Oscillospiraceae bacterium]